MTKQSITSNQERQYRNFVWSGSKNALKKVNPDKDGLQRFFERGDEFQDYLAEGVRRFSIKVPDYSYARNIFGDDFISPEEVAKKRPRAVYTEKQFAQFSRTLPSEEVLQWGKDNGCMLVAGPPKDMSFKEVYNLKPGYFSLNYNIFDVKNSLPQNDEVKPRWIMIRKKPITDSTRKNWYQQQKLVSNLEIVPNTTEVVWAITTYKEVRDIYLLKGYVRTSSINGNVDHGSVGGFNSEGLRIRNFSDEDTDGDLGLLTERKL